MGEEEREIVEVEGAPAVAEGDDEGQVAEASQEEEGEVEVTVELDGDGSPPKRDTNAGFRRRINRLKAKAEEKISATEDEARRYQEELEAERERNRLLQMALEERKGGDMIPPDPMDYDGVSDPEYIKALKAFNAATAREVVESVIEQSGLDRREQVRDTEIEKQLERHARDAEKLGVPDYDDTEQKAIDVLGGDFAREIVKRTEASPALLYYLGKNPSRAEELAHLRETDPVKCVMEVGALAAGLKVRRKPKQGKPAPESETDVRGSSADLSPLLRGATFE